MGTTWRIGEKLMAAELPAVMGILNATPDSFHPRSRISIDDVLLRAEEMLLQGAAILDIGGASSRPGSHEVPLQEELDRVLPVVEKVHQHFPQALISIDTWRAEVARQAVQAGAGMVNDISAGLLDEALFTTVAALHVPLVIMHMQGTPRTMQQAPDYKDVTREVTLFLSSRMNAARAAGVADPIIDPGFGFGKTTRHNFTLLRSLGTLCGLGVPVLAGLSRKRMINEVLATNAAEALNGTTVLNTLALLNGASILRVHDVKEAVQCVRLLHHHRVLDP
jgi:dihydropteroate synthase